MSRASAIATVMLTLLLLSSRDAEAACSISTTGVSFGNYDVYAPSPVDSTGSVTYDCSANTKDVIVTLSRGASPTFTPRTLRYGAEALNYNLYIDAARTSIWGDGTSGTEMYSIANAPNKPVILTIFGRIPAGQDVSAGSYSDAVVVTIQF